MTDRVTDREYDVIVVGSGTCGATLARELARRHKKVLILEQGQDHTLRETFSSMAAVTKEYSVGKDLKAATAVTVGGSTSLYFGVCKLPTAETYASLGIDLSAEVAEAKRELPVAELPDQFLSPQSLVLRKSAAELGYKFKKNLMLVDQSKCDSGRYEYDARWKAKSYVEEAVDFGATLITQAAVTRVLIEDGRAVGVEYKHKQGFMRTKLCTARGKRIVLSTGALATPKLLIDCGIKNIGDRGFFCKPAYMVCGTVPGLQATDTFVGNQDIELGKGFSLGDGAMSSLLFKLVMLANLKWRYLFSFSKMLSMGILIYDSMGGEVGKDGSFRKQLTAAELQKLQDAEQIAIEILKNAGARNIFRTKLMAGIPGGTIRIKEHVDENLQTDISHLYVCDHSLMSDVMITPTFTLICLAKRLAKHLSASLQPSQARSAPALKVVARAS
ncbi:FAD-dependent oxidoreductase [Steroidobacter cummioxidans]|uniref:FAD-dependent oxidoreductase n=1 Tax=Steroidobacter cummioxidans TaxID=1803913 RepID=UPI000E31161B|nr:FAD-dependent oxidoreductase [Steroidobacter cummioxidans]